MLKIIDKKLFILLFIAIFLVVSFSFVSAESTDDGVNSTINKITVKIKWNDNGQASARPDFVTVYLLKNGKTVDEKILNSSNSWTATFDVEDDGSYSVKQSVEPSNYSVSTKGSVSDGFIITNTIKSDILGAAEDDDAVENNTTLSVAETENPIEDENETVNETVIENNTSAVNNTADNNTKENNQTNATGQQNTSKNVKQPAKKEDKKPKEVTKNRLLNTGIPIIALVIVVFAAVFVLFRRKK